MMNGRRRMPAGAGGYSLVELMVALAIGLFILGAVVSLFVTSKSSYRAQEGVDALQENGRYAIRALADDVRLAGFVGITYDPIKVSPQKYTATAVGSACTATAADWVNFGQPIYGLNASTLSGAGSDARNAGAKVTGCVSSSEYKTGTDILVLRHANNQTVAAGALAENTLYLFSELDRASFFIGTTAPTPATNPSVVHEVNIHVYYIRPYAVAVGDGIPTLVRETLVPGPAMVAQPLVEGIENMQ
ncbi:MAG: hypothetical protein HY942_00265, partial [Gammaproteobacteria bacterium]|nr:hypothetical protein [Gammaproteobacteria bacterium]